MRLLILGLREHPNERAESPQSDDWAANCGRRDGTDDDGSRKLWGREEERRGFERTSPSAPPRCQSGKKNKIEIIQGYFPSSDNRPH